MHVEHLPKSRLHVCGIASYLSLFPFLSYSHAFTNLRDKTLLAVQRKNPKGGGGVWAPRGGWQVTPLQEANNVTAVVIHDDSLRHDIHKRILGPTVGLPYLSQLTVLDLLS